MKFLCKLLLLFPITISNALSLEKIFTIIYDKQVWAKEQKESVSGVGSTLYQTTHIRKIFPQLLNNLHIKKILDAPCGDFNWMKTIDLSKLEAYIGVDIVKDLIVSNKKLYKKNNIFFLHKDISKDTLPDVDLILCRDLFLHLRYEDIFCVLRNFKKNKAKYLLTSTYAEIKINMDRKEVNAGFRPINLELAPFKFPKPLLLIDDFKLSGKYLGLWQTEFLPNY